VTASRRSVWRAALAGLIAVASVAGCGGAQRQFAGSRLEPLPVVGGFSLPDVANGGADFALRAAPGTLLVVYWGYTNCPDFCPTTMSDLKLARARLDAPERVEVAMVTVDPERDLALDPARCDVPTSFVPEAHALGTDDGDRLAAAAAPFGVAYHVGDADGTDQAEVQHTTSLYAIDDTGALVLTWQFGVSIDDLAADLEQLLSDVDR
jgi:protein SCO1/2